MNADLTKYSQMGKESYKNGEGQIPRQCKKLMNAISGLPVGGGSIEIMNAWLDGWHQACDKAFFGDDNF